MRGDALQGRHRRSDVDFLTSLLKAETGIATGKDLVAKNAAKRVLQSFLLSFANRAASREREHVFVTNYDSAMVGR